jgi:vacuolar-type H+-ATPase subunit B/Vma2
VEYIEPTVRTKMISEERQQELLEAAETRTATEDLLIHSFGLHVNAALQQISIALAELEEVAIEGDERVLSAISELSLYLDKLSEISHAAIDEVPGVLTREESEDVAYDMLLNEFGGDHLKH